MDTDPTTPEATDPIEETAPEAIQPAPEPAPDAEPAATPEPEPEAPTEAPEPDTQPAPFAELFPSFNEWFDRVQKRAQFMGRPIPEPGPVWEAAYQSEQNPYDAADEHGLKNA